MTARPGPSSTLARGCRLTASGSTRTMRSSHASCTRATRGKYVRSRWNSVSTAYRSASASAETTSARDSSSSTHSKSVTDGLRSGWAPGHPGSSPFMTPRPDRIHASVPPATLVASMPLAARNSAARLLRPPLLQITSTPSAGTSDSRSGTVASGMSVAPGTWPAVYSSGSRTSITGAPSSLRRANSSMSISGTVTDLLAPSGSADRRLGYSMCAADYPPRVRSPPSGSGQVLRRVDVAQDLGRDRVHVDDPQPGAEPAQRALPVREEIAHQTERRVDLRREEQRWPLPVGHARLGQLTADHDPGDQVGDRLVGEPPLVARTDHRELALGRLGVLERGQHTAEWAFAGVAVGGRLQAQARQGIGVATDAHDVLAATLEQRIRDPLRHGDAVDLEQRLVRAHAAARAAGQDVAADQATPP